MINSFNLFQWQKGIQSSEGRSLKRWAFIIAGITVIVIVGGILIFLSIRNSNSHVTNTYQKLEESQSFHVVADLQLRLPFSLRGRERPVQKVSIHIDGDGLWNEQQVETVGSLAIEATGRGMVLYAKGDYRVFPDTVAFRLDEMPTLLDPSGNLLNKWTYVNVPLLRINDKDEMRTALQNFFKGWREVNNNEKKGLSGDGTRHFEREVTPEQEEILAEVFRQGRSGNRALHVITRLLWAFDVASVDVYVSDGKKEISDLVVEFVHPDRNNEGATLHLSFSDYNKDVTLPNPPLELTVKPEVFAKLFGSGEVSAIE